MSRDVIHAEVDRERTRQDEKWGGPEHDRSHGPFDWVVFLSKYLGNFARGAINHDRAMMRQALVQVAALCFAALENCQELN